MLNKVPFPSPLINESLYLKRGLWRQHGVVPAEEPEGRRKDPTRAGVKVGSVNLISPQKLQFASPFNYYFLLWIQIKNKLCVSITAGIKIVP